MFFERLSLFFAITGRLFHVTLQMLYGAWKVSKLPKPIVTIFGGSRFMQTDAYAQQAHALARRFVDANISVITGGGPGIMEAAHCGTIPVGKGKGRSIGIGVEGLEGPNKCVQDFFSIHYFFARKWLMTRFSEAFIVFPGGFGTLDEVFELLVLKQQKRIGPDTPIILVGSAYWQPLIAWIVQEMATYNIVEQIDMHLFVMTDSLDEVFEIVRTSHPVQAKQRG